MNRVALVTGGSRGIGRTIATTLAQKGHPVALTYLTHEREAREATAVIAQAGGRATAVRLVAEDRATIRRALDEVRQELGPIAILVNNAAIAQEKPFPEITDDDWDRMFAVNVRGPFSCAQEVLPDMLQQRWGRIVNISSVGGQWGGVLQVHYACAKAALNNLTRSLAKLYSRQGVTTNTVAGYPNSASIGAASWFDAYPSSKVTTTDRRGRVPSRVRRSASANVRPT